MDDQATVFDFNTTKLGFHKETEVSVGDFCWLSVGAPDDVEGVELLLEQATHPGKETLYGSR